MADAKIKFILLAVHAFGQIQRVHTKGKKSSTSNVSFAYFDEVAGVLSFHGRVVKGTAVTIYWTRSDWRGTEMCKVVHIVDEKMAYVCSPNMRPMTTKHLLSSPLPPSRNSSLPPLPSMSNDLWLATIDDTFASVRRLGEVKGAEYSGDVDRLANFKRNGESLGVAPELVWAVYAGKHWDAIQTYVRDLTTGQDRVRSEPISGRIDDLVTYLLLFKLMLRARNEVNSNEEN